MPIQWYPGHMTKTKRMMQAHMAQVDVVVELLDARIPLSSKNPDIDRLAKDKHRIVVLNKADLAAPEITRQWEDFYAAQGFRALVLDSRSKAGIGRLPEMARALTREKAERQQQRGRINVPVRAMVVGIPNVGKSTLINQLAGRASAVTGDRPGVTRGRQWIKVGVGFDLLDTPGVLWPKFDDEAVGVKLAVTGAVSDEILDRVTLCEQLLALLLPLKPDALTSRYKISLTDPQTLDNQTPRALLEMIGNARGFKMKGGHVDIERAAIVVLDEFRGGKLGRITLESPPRPAPVLPDPSQN